MEYFHFLAALVVALYSVSISTTVRNFCMWTMCTWKLTHSLVDLLEENHCLGFHIHFHLSSMFFSFINLFSTFEKFLWGMKSVKFGGLKSALQWDEKVTFRGMKRYKSGFDHPFLAIAYYPFFWHTILLFLNQTSFR